MEMHDGGDPSTCYDCGQPAEVIDLNKYGPGKPGAACTVCYVRDNAPNNGVQNSVHTSVWGHDAEVVVLTEHATCSNCGLHLLALDAIKDPGLLEENQR